jgi:prepilin-type N-terminal cleavage/methylation domain-containing protein
MKLSKNKKGFTLVELLLVMAIIGILAGIIFISIGSTRKRARITTFKEAMKNLAVASTQCVDAGGEIAGRAAKDALCDDSGGTTIDIGNIPEIKECNGTNDTISINPTTPTGDDFVIEATCKVATDLECQAVCNVNGCYFDDSGETPGEDHNNGCPNTKAP